MNSRFFNYILSGTLILCFAAFACTDTATTPASSSSTTATASTGKIVFVRQDSVIEQYTALQEKLETLEEKYTVLNEEQQNRISSFQRQVESFQRRAGSGQMAPKAVQDEQSALGLREQQLMEDANRLQQESQYEQLELMKIFQDNVQAVLDAIQDENNYDYILNYGSGTGVLMVNDAFDITADVVTRLKALPMEAAAEDDATEEEATDAAESEE